MMALAEVSLLDPVSMTKVGSGARSRRKTTTNNMTMGGHSSLRQLGQSLRVFGDDRGIGMVIRSDLREGLEAMAEAQASILTI